MERGENSVIHFDYQKVGQQCSREIWIFPLPVLKQTLLPVVQSSPQGHKGPLGGGVSQKPSGHRCRWNRYSINKKNLPERVDGYKYLRGGVSPQPGPNETTQLYGRSGLLGWQILRKDLVFERQRGQKQLGTAHCWLSQPPPLTVFSFQKHCPAKGLVT